MLRSNFSRKYLLFSLPPQILKGLPTVDGRPGESMAPMNFQDMKTKLVEEHGPRISDYDVLSSAMYPQVCFGGRF